MIAAITESPLVAMARRGKRLPHVALLLPVLLLAVLVSFAASSLSMEAIYAGAEYPEQAYLDSPAFLILPFSLLLTFLWVWLLLYEKRPFWTLGLPLKGAVRRLAVGALAGAGMMAVIVGTMALVGCVTVEGGGHRITGAEALGPALVFFLSYLVQAGTEEVVFRGWVFQTVTARHALWLGLTVNIALFGLMHFPKTPATILQLVLFGGFATLYAIKEGSVWGVCGWHAAWNWTQSNLFGLALTGHDSASASVLDLGTRGHELLTGGEFGPEASIVSLAVLFAGSWYFFVALRRQYGKSTVNVAPACPS